MKEENKRKQNTINKKKIEKKETPETKKKETSSKKATPNKEKKTVSKNTATTKNKQKLEQKKEPKNTPKKETIQVEKLPINKQNEKKKTTPKSIPQKQNTKDTTNEKKKYTLPPIFTKINYKQLCFKLFILLLVMILIIFTISRIKKHHEKQNSVINANIKTITDATINYYQNNSLPININDSYSFLLEEMKNLKLIGDIKDENNKFCNYLDSYTILTKITDNEYRLKINLNCPSKNKIMEEKIICNGKNCSIEK